MGLNTDEEVLRTDDLSTIRAWRMQLEHGNLSFSNWVQLSFPAKEIIGLFFTTGKHIGHPLLLEELLVIQKALSQLQIDGDTFAYKLLSTLMRIFLDKHTNTFDHLTYTALPIFELFQDDGDFETLLQNQAKIVIALICDLIKYEIKTMLGQECRMQEYLPGMQKLNQRIYVSFRAVLTCSFYADHLRLPANTDHLIELWRQQTQQETPYTIHLANQTNSFAEEILEQLDAKLNRLLQLTLIPVYVSHDEYMFVRILQAFEMLFHVVAEGLKLCISHVTAERYQQAADRFYLLNDVLRLSPAIFRILSTMTSYTFNTFREYMTGASAIQSVYYKQIELYASHPDLHRFRSPAFESVPKVLDEYQQQSFRNLQDVVVPLLTDANPIHEDSIQNMIAGMKALDKTFVTWKVTHYRLVKAMIGDSPGTGHTSGPPYLKQILEQPLFPFITPRLSESAVI
jgi:tryptophan 2,3-dioxygenase